MQRHAEAAKICIAEIWGNNHACDTPTLTLKNESSDPFSMYSTTIITGLPAKTHKDSTYTVFISEYFCGIVARLQCRVEDKIEGAWQKLSETHNVSGPKHILFIKAGSSHPNVTSRPLKSKKWSEEVLPEKPSTLLAPTIATCYL